MVAIANFARSQTEVPYARTSDSPCSSVNVADWERIASGIGGAFLVLRGLNQGGLMGLGLAGTGAALVYRGVTGHCHLYDHLGINTATPAPRGVTFEANLTLDKPREEVFRLYRAFTAQPRMSEILQPFELRPGRALWTLKDPSGTTHQWETELIAEHAGEYVAWRSTPDARIRSYSSLRFEMAPGGAGTHLHLTFVVHPRFAAPGVAEALDALPEDWGERHLAGFKNWVGSRATTSMPALNPRM